MHWNPKLSAEISKKKAQNILKTGADIVLTTCPACVLGILQGFAVSGVLHKKPPKVMNVMEFLAKAEGIKLDKNMKKWYHKHVLFKNTGGKYA